MIHQSIFQYIHLKKGSVNTTIVPLSNQKPHSRPFLILLRVAFTRFHIGCGGIFYINVNLVGGGGGGYFFF